MSARTENLFQTLPPDARVLVVRLRSMGDCLLLTSPLRALKEQFPRFRLTVLAESRFISCFDGNPDIEEVIAVGGSKFSVVRGLVGRRFDAIVNLHGGPTSLVYSLAAWGKRYGLDDFPYHFIYSGLIPRGPAAGHTVEGTLAWFRWLGVNHGEPPPLYYAPHANERTWVLERVGTEPYVTIHPAAVMDTKRWTPSRFNALARMISGSGWRVVVTAGPGEEDLAREVACDIDPSLLLLGLTIPQLAELIRGADLYVGNDSGPMHLAAAVGTPVLVPWGSSNAQRWRPWKVPHRVVQNPFECNPCPGYRCYVADSPLCIESVTVPQVEEAFWALVGESGLPSPLAVKSED